MPSTMLPEVARDNAEYLRGVFDRLDIAALPPRRLEEVLFLVRQCQVLFGQLSSALEDTLAEGLEARELRALASMTVQALDAYLSVLEHVRKQVPVEAISTAAGSFGWAELAAWQGQAEQLRRTATELLEWANTPPTPLNREKIAEAEEAFRRGEYKSISGERLP